MFTVCFTVKGIGKEKEENWKMAKSDLLRQRTSGGIDIYLKTFKYT